MEEKTEEQKALRKAYLMNRFKVISNIVLIVLFLAIGIYVFSEIEAFKQVGQDACKFCMEKTGATCYKLTP